PGCPIIPLLLGGSQDCLRASQLLRSQGIHALPILYPAVSHDRARLRFFVSCLHTEEQLARTAEAVGQSALQSYPR
ncbi:MAG: 8-amino-7-oxononanoate synthase, partial [Candidatus Eremiobacterota bacterium]